MLFACLKCKAYCRVTVTVYGDSHYTTGNIAFKCILSSYIAGCRAAEAHRESESLGCAYCDVGAPGSRFLEQRKCKEVAIGCYENALFMSFGAE